MKPKFAMTLLVILFVACGRKDDAESAIPVVLELKNGQRIEGMLKNVSRFGLVMQVQGRSVTTPIGEARVIYLDTKNMATSADGEAIEALRAVRALTNVGTNIRDFSTKVAEAEVKVEKLPDGEVEKPIRAALLYYMLAVRAWRSHTDTDVAGLSDVGRAVISGDCQEAKNMVQVLTKPAKPEVAGYMLGEHPQPLWSCASAKISEAEKAALGK
jgi:hypothetical protein